VVLPASVLLFVIVPLIWISEAHAQSHAEHQSIAGESDSLNNQSGGHASGGWEGSAEGMAYSEFNHHLAGLFDVAFGLAELGNALKYPLPLWTRLVLPGALGITGVYLMVWSDHDAWPIGSLGFVETFFGHDWEIIEHKIYSVLAVAIAVCETLRRIGRVRHPAWAAPLVFLTLVGGLLLFVHSHGNHPASERIAFHHALLGTVGIGAAISKALASWMPGTSRRFVKLAEVAWAGFVILFGLLLLIYSE
jgi:putative copper resistance protein D